MAMLRAANLAQQPPPDGRFLPLDYSGLRQPEEGVAGTASPRHLVSSRGSWHPLPIRVFQAKGSLELHTHGPEIPVQKHIAQLVAGDLKGRWTQVIAPDRLSRI